MSRNRQTLLIKFGAILMLLSLISACGQKGDLYLPPEEVTQHGSNFTKFV